MKPNYSYIGDSSDGEKQLKIEKEFLSNKEHYLTHLHQGISHTRYKVTYILKDIGARLLHHKQVTKKYFKLKTLRDPSCGNTNLQTLINGLKLEIIKANDMIGDKYILGRFLTHNQLPLNLAADYFNANKTNISNFIQNRFPNINFEEKFRTKLNSIYVKYTKRKLPLTLEDRLPQLYESIIEHWNNSKRIGIEFNIKFGKRTKFAQEIRSHISKIKLQKILDQHKIDTLRQKIVGDFEAKIYYFLKHFYAAERDLTQQLLESKISELDFFINTEKLNAVDFLAKTRYYHKAMRGIVKNTLIHKDNFKIGKTTIPNMIGSAVYTNPDSPELGTVKIYEINTIYKTGARTSKILGSTGKLDGRYVDLLSDIIGLSQKTDLSLLFKAILKGHFNQLYSTSNAFTIKESHYVHDLTFLLFASETTRNVGAFLTNAMFFDLISKSYYSISDLVIKLPITMEKAVASSLKAEREFGVKYGETDGELSSVLHYDFRPNIKGFDLKSLNDKNITILRDWILYYKMEINKSFTEKVKDLKLQDTVKTLNKEIGDNIRIKVINENLPLKDYGKEFVIIKNEYQITLKVEINSNTEEVMSSEFEINKIPLDAFNDLIEEWYGVSTTYLSGNICFEETS